jgi:FemAB-related protein (PEP-CTERM system-associated)
MTQTSSAVREVAIHRGHEILSHIPEWQEFVVRRGAESPTRNPAWLGVLADGLGHTPIVIEARAGDRLVGLLPLALVRSLWFGRYLVGLPYLNVGGVVAADDDAAAALVDRAVRLSDELDVRHLELRHETPIGHPALGPTRTDKVHMRLDLPGTSEELWAGFDPKVRNQIRKGEKAELSVHFGRYELLAEFYAVFAQNMRDLGTPVFGRTLFRAALDWLTEEAEFCVVRLGRQPVAAALLVHGPRMTEVPSASSLRHFNATNANMLMYWRLLRRAIERGSEAFDFGRSTIDGNTYRFKKQWGARPHPAVWQYYVRKGDFTALRAGSGRFDSLIRAWQRLPVAVTRLIGPAIVRGIP